MNSLNPLETAKNHNIEVFGYKEILSQMIKMEKRDRFKSFNEINREILNKENIAIDFEEPEKKTYRCFADGLIQLYSKIETDSQYITDVTRIIENLEKIYKNNILEKSVQNPVELTRCFVSGEYRYKKHQTIYVSYLKEFIELLKNNPKEKQKVIVNNLQNRLDSIERYANLPFSNDDIPF